MPKTTKRSTRTHKAKTTSELTKELTAVKAEVEILREHYTRMNRTLIRLCCPKEWFDEVVDDDELWSKAVWEPKLGEVIDSLK
jgi:hypothetical protein